MQQMLGVAKIGEGTMVLGGLFRNPNIASPATSVLYMIIVMITPFYANLNALPRSAKLAYCFNPFAHVTSLIGSGFGQPMLCSPLVSIGILFVLTVILGILVVKRRYSTYGAEKLGG